MPNGAKNGRLHTLTGHNADTSPSVVTACVHLTQLLIVLRNRKIKKTKQRACFCGISYRNKKTLTDPVLLDLL